MTEIATRTRILNAAEALFAAQGFAGTSLRQVTQAAGANLASVNYHFGSKTELVNEVFRRRLDQLHQGRERALDRLEADTTNGHPSLESLLAAFIMPAIDTAASDPEFMQVIARAYVEHSRELRRFLAERYGALNKRFFAAFARAVPDDCPQAVAWRIDFLIASLTYTMAGFGGLKPAANQSQTAFLNQGARELIAFAAAGLRARTKLMESAS